MYLSFESRNKELYKFFTDLGITIVSNDLPSNAYEPIDTT